MNTLFRYALPALLLALTSCSSEKPRIHIIGGTTVGESDPNTTQACGWGQILGQIAPDGAEVINHARVSCNSLTFYKDGCWTETRKDIRPGDYVLIQFAHDDERCAHADCKGANSPWGAFRENLSHFIDETRQSGGIPILVQPIVRRIFEGNSISKRGTHNFGRNAADTQMDYTFAIRNLADSLGVSVIDLCSVSKRIVEAYGLVGSKEQLFVWADNTNTCAKGAALFALAVAEALDTMNVWSGTHRTPAVVASRKSIDLGNVFVGDTVWQIVDLVNIDGITTRRVLSHRKLLTVAAPPGFKLSRLPGGEPKDSLMFFTNATAQVVISYSPSAATCNAGELSVRTENSTSKILVKANGVIANQKGQTTIEWQDTPTAADNQPIPLRLSAIRGLELTQEGIMPINGIWSSDPNPAEFVQFKLTNKSQSLRISEISIESSSSQSYHVACSLGYDFFRNLPVGQRIIKEDNDNSTRRDVFKTSIHVRAGQTMLLRIYLSSASTSLAKPFHISNMKLTMDTFE